ncbi:hypothetical protein KUL25_10330 [Rhodobacteraceae bacterium N5(2021)]|uniref:Uncharacterized protein n=1 Tax=Gymnodinialimonas phycosphaerae TaxID=2841589 RepID=A0A975TYW0_9RHOB|nr:hypothetical protein [Gymnodinialimonas phycosphaerae]MBY4893161.1 hypothetical protein [Gymnodinialimonas phycosphaerae]
MDVVLHIGAHRTASATFQHHMSRSRADMAEGGVVYWGPKIVRGGLFRGAIGGVEGVMASQERRFAGRCAMRAEAVRQTGATHLVISDENMIGSLRAALEHTRLYPDAGRRIAAYAHGFERHRVTVAVCVRDYADWWTSAMAFRLSRGGPLPRTDLRECLVTQPRRWRHIVEELARVLPDARIVVWSHEASASAPHRLLQELTGFSTPALDTAPRNLRPTAEALRQVMTDCDIDPAQFNWPEGRFMPFTADETEALDAQYQEDLAWLSAGAGGFADYIDAPSAQTEAQTALGRGRSDDGDHRQLA